ncbi:hypothetical protein GO730_02705 [Spirosoma sp. HMF3257]|uniref:Uncharacterized protein n=1 Tax=Spirosoma telluris TaxID=2183553 RepID=A0A327NLX2_9BACT|nr:hypothetical protein [Spirosoma telluris]RAI73598.1 hypothetical protein HMF3257_02645 [Spirosoma telluris]
MLTKFLLALWLLGNSSPCTPKSNAVFMQMIDSQKGSFTTQDPDDEWYGLPWHTLGVKEFKPFARIYNNPTLYVACAMEYMRDTTYNHRSKHFALLSMEKLPFKDCLKTLALCYRLYKSGLIHEETLSEALLLGFSESNVFDKNKGNPALVSILKKMASDKTLPTYMHKTISRMLN